MRNFVSAFFRDVAKKKRLEKQKNENFYFDAPSAPHGVWKRRPLGLEDAPQAPEVSEKCMLGPMIAYLLALPVAYGLSPKVPRLTWKLST